MLGFFFVIIIITNFIFVTVEEQARIGPSSRRRQRLCLSAYARPALGRRIIIIEVFAVAVSFFTAIIMIIIFHISCLVDSHHRTL